MTPRPRATAGQLAERAGHQAVSALLEWDERLVNRAEPPTDRPLQRSMYPWSQPIEQSWTVVRSELDQLIASGTKLPTTSDLAGSDQGAEGEWTTYVLHWYGTWLPEQCERFPETIKLIEKIPNIQIAGFTVLGPRTHIPRHQGPAKSLRWQLGVRIPEPPDSCRLKVGDHTVPWTDGASLAFDDRTPHEAWNDSDDARYVLFVQVAWPVKGLTGRVHRTNHRLFGSALRGIPRRVRDLDVALNGPGDAFPGGQPIPQTSNETRG